MAGEAENANRVLGNRRMERESEGKVVTAPAKLATVAEGTEATPNVTSQTTTLTQESVLNFLRDLPTDEYQQMAEAWGKLTTEEDFSQA